MFMNWQMASKTSSGSMWARYIFLGRGGGCGKTQRQYLSCLSVEVKILVPRCHPWSLPTVTTVLGHR